MIKDKMGLVEKIVTEIRKFTDIAVIGMSGGVDSTVVATLCQMALGAEKVYGIHMPYNATDNSKFNSNSRKIADKLGIKSLDAPIFEIAEGIDSAVTKALSLGADIDKLGHVNSGNARSRSRMCVLYGIAHELNTHLDKRARVIGTGNLSEDFIGYDTKGGDALADIFPIGELFKSEVYQLAEFFVEENKIDANMIDRTPSAGLWEGQTDEEELGYTYNEMEASIRRLRIPNGDIIWESSGIEDSSRYTDVDKFVHRRHIANKHKHLASPVINLRGMDMLK